MYLTLVQASYRATGSPEFAQISIDAVIRRCKRRCGLQARSGRCAFCTNSRLTFIGSPYPYLPFHMHLTLVQASYRATGSPEFAQISIDAVIRRCKRRCGLQARYGRWAFSTNTRLTFQGSPFPYLPFHMHLAVVQPFYRARGSP